MMSVGRFSEADEVAEGLGLIGHCTTALLNNGLGRYARALAAAERACEYPVEFGLLKVILPELIEAATRSGKRERALDALRLLMEETDGPGTDWSRGIEARSRALLSEGQAAEHLYREAVDRLSRTKGQLDLARAHLVFGEWLRRENRRVEGRAHLRTAHEMFLRIGAEAFVERAGRELLATGGSARKRTVDTRFDLTAQEEQIARLAGEGCTNGEIGRELFISPRTVEWHLHKVYPKLGITSRRDLRFALPDRRRVATSA